MLSLSKDEWESPLVPLLCDEVVKDEPGQAAVLDRLLDLLVRGNALAKMLIRTGPALAPASKLMRTELDSEAEYVEAALRGADAMLAGEATDRLLYAPGMQLGGGTSEIQRNIIGERLLGLPREPRP